MTVVTRRDTNKASWDGLFQRVRPRLAQGTISTDLVTKIEGFAKWRGA